MGSNNISKNLVKKQKWLQINTKVKRNKHGFFIQIYPVTDEEVEVFDVRLAIGILEPRELFFIECI